MGDVGRRLAERSTSPLVDHQNGAVVDHARAWFDGYAPGCIALHGAPMVTPCHDQNTDSARYRRTSACELIMTLGDFDHDCRRSSMGAEK